MTISKTGRKSSAFPSKTRRASSSEKVKKETNQRNLERDSEEVMEDETEGKEEFERENP